VQSEVLGKLIKFNYIIGCLNLDLPDCSTDIGKYSFVNRTIQFWNQLPEVASEIFSCKTKQF
jgi:hypothetical protein